jgi:hypothetical protein
MNIRNFCIFPDGRAFISYLRAARHLWLPLEQVDECVLEMNHPCIVFNISEEEIDPDRHLSYFFAINDERWKDPSLHLPVEAIARAYTLCDKAIEWAKEHDECYNQRYDENLEELLEPGRTGYSRWLHRCRLYGGLLNAYNYH